jgi:hypothetical protein
LGIQYRIQEIGNPVLEKNAVECKITHVSILPLFMSPYCGDMNKKAVYFPSPWYGLVTCFGQQNVAKSDYVPPLDLFFKRPWKLCCYYKKASLIQPAGEWETIRNRI